MVWGGDEPPLFFTKFPKISEKFRFSQANYKQIKCNYLIYNKIKILFFLLKSIVFIKFVVYLQCQTTTTTTTKQHENTIET